MNKNKVMGLALGAAITLLPLLASAATISNPLFSNGQNAIDATGGATVSGTYTLTVGPGEVVEWNRTWSDTMPFSDTSVGGSLGYQEGVYTNLPFSVKVSPNTGTYNAYSQGAGTYGGNRSINGGDNVVVGPSNLGMVRVVASATSGDTTVGGSDKPSWLDAMIASLIAALKPAPTPVPTASAACTTFASKMSGAVMGTNNAANVKLQGFLLSEGASIPALAAGASFGYYGSQTASAVAWFNSLNHCN